MQGKFPHPFMALMVVLLLGRASLAHDFDIVKLDGSTTRVQAFGIVRDEVVFDEQGKSTSLPLKSLRAIRRSGAVLSNSAANKQGMLASLIDGSLIAFNQIEGKNDEWDLTVGSSKLTIAKQQMKWLRFRQPTAKEATAWAATLQEPGELDRLIIARGEGVLDQAAGELLAIGKEKVDFRFDSDVIEAPRAKLLGIVWFRSTTPRIEPSIRITTTSGSKWFAKELKVDAGPQPALKWKTTSGMEGSAGVVEWADIDFASLNLKWLHQAPFISKQPELVISTELLAAERGKMFAAKFQSTEGSKSSDDQDLFFPAPGEIIFRVPEGFKTFEAMVQRSASGDARSPIVLEVYQNDQKLWESTLKPNDKAIPCSFEVRENQRLKLIVKSPSTLMAGSEVRWIQPRFSR